MTTRNEVYDFLANMVSHVTFDYNGKPCGVDPYYDGKRIFDVWYGEKLDVFYNVDDVFSAPFFDGKSLDDIIPIVNVELG